MTSKFWACTYHLSSGPWRWPDKAPLGVVRMSGQLEEAPTTGSLHYQFILITENVHRRTGVQKLLGTGDKLHCEIMRKCLLANDRYVAKEGTRVSPLPTLTQEPIRKLHPIDWLLTRRTHSLDIFQAKSYHQASRLYYDPEYHDWLNSRPWLDVNAERLTEEEIASF